MMNPLGPDFENLWDEKVATANHISNRMFSNGCQVRTVSPIDGLNGIKHDVSHLRELGCTALVNIPERFRGGKFSSRARKGMIVGCLVEECMVYIPESGRILVSRHINTIEQTSQLAEVLVDRESTEKLC